MNCPNCGADLYESSNLCHICGAKINGEAVAPAQQTAPRRPLQPMLGMIFGIISTVLASLDYVVVVYRVLYGYTWTAVIILSILCVIAAIVALVFSIIGMKRSIRTGGRKYVAGIVFSAIGLETSASSLILMMITPLIVDIIHKSVFLK